ncbi:MAG: UDP-glucose dehydrogenase family protein, partial [Candidatus Thorarchaeota archaeon]
MRIAVIGAGYVGLSTAVVLAKKHNVILLEIDQKKIDSINRGLSPIVEEGLEPLLQSALQNKRIRAVSIDDKIGPQDAILICVNTPTADDNSVNLDAVHSVLKRLENEINQIADGFLLIVMRSTVPPGTTRREVIERFSKHSESHQLGFIFQPEFLRQGYAIQDLQKPDRVIIGATDSESFKKYCEITIPCLENEDTPVLQMSIESAELCKYASNSFLATKISFVSELSALAEKVPNVDIDDVVSGMVADHRICPSHLMPGLGYGGSCLPKDVSGLFMYAKTKGIEMELLKAVHSVNKHTTERLMALFKSTSLNGKKVALLGIAFKADTDDIRDSPSLPLLKILCDSGAIVYVHDPIVDLSMVRNHLGLEFNISSDVDLCTNGASAVILMTDWKLYADLGLEKITSNMAEKLFIDGR